MHVLRAWLTPPSPTPVDTPAPAAAGPPPAAPRPPAPQAWRSKDSYDKAPATPPLWGGAGGDAPLYAAGPARAQAAITELAAPPATHPMMVYAADVRARLAKAGLPTDASGVQVTVLGEDASTARLTADHGPAIARTIAGPIGLARGATVDLRDPVIAIYAGPPLSQDEATIRMRRGGEAIMGTGGLANTIGAGIDQLETQIERTGAEVRALTADTSGGTTRIATMSWGQSPTRVGLELANAAIARGNDAPLIREINGIRKNAGLPAFDVNKPDDVMVLRGDIIRSLTRAIDHGDGKARLDAARATLGKDVAAARDKGIVLFAAAGNEHNPNGLIPGADRSAIAGTPGIIMVGATDPHDPVKRADDRVAEFSNDGALISAPGVRMPVGAPEAPTTPAPATAPAKPGKPAKAAPVEEEGTSLAAPYAASVAALMVKASPAITPAEIERILVRTAIDDPSSTRDGAGALDPVAAVAAARALRPKAKAATARP